MKKTYITPIMETIRMEVSQMIAQSSDSTYSMSGNTSTNSVDAGSVLGKDRDNNLEGGMGSLW